eukprot:999920-Amphidinium_carterae.1
MVLQCSGPNRVAYFWIKSQYLSIGARFTSPNEIMAILSSRKEYAHCSKLETPLNSVHFKAPSGKLWCCVWHRRGSGATYEFGGSTSIAHNEKPTKGRK